MYEHQKKDRESWLSLYDGKPIRVIRAGKAKTVSGARVNIFGGIQPEIFHSVFGGDEGLYLADGTIFRILATFEGEKFFPLTAESWSEEGQAVWENTLYNAMTWADERISVENWKAHNLCLTQEAQEYFFDWRNELYSQKPELPDIVKGFLPKIVGSALRLSGALHCMDHFARNDTPKNIMVLEDIHKGIKVAMFYMGHIVNAMELLLSENYTPEIIAEQPY